MTVLTKYKSQDFTNFVNDFKHVDEESIDSILEVILKYYLNYSEYYDESYNNLKEINLVYYSKTIENQTQKKKIEYKDKRAVINSLFYEGLGDI